MPTTVLILENDLAFAGELANGLRSLGAEATIIEDPNQGLQHAAAEHPNLIVLAVELHKMNGFSVCSRIKKEPTLSSIPVVLVTSNSTDVTIEQHRQRPNHADDYIRKPIAVPDLIDRLTRWVALLPSKRPSLAPGDDGIIIDDEVLESAGSRPPSLRPRANVIPVDSDVSAFADSAFDGIMAERPSSVVPQRTDRWSPSNRRSQSPVSAVEPIPNSSPSAVPASVPPSSESTRVHVRVLEDALEEANARIRELESRDLSAKEAELETLRHELDDARAKLMVVGRSGTSSGSTAREVLDLREQLHKKEKELLDLRDRLTQREKEQLSLKDTSLTLEREKADLSDRLDDIARQLTETQRHADVARSDKEAAAKRAEDAKRRIDKLTQQLEEKAQELDQQRSLYDSVLSDHATEKARWLEGQQATEARAASDLRSAMAQASSEINLQAEKARQHLEQSLAEARTAAESQMQHELDNLRHELGEDKAAALTAQERELANRLTREHTKALDRCQTEYASELQRTRAASDAALHAANSKREQSEQQRDEQIAALRRELEDSALSLAKACDRLALLEREVERAKSKWSEDRNSIERTKDALAVALVQLEAIEQRPLETP